MPQQTTECDKSWYEDILEKKRKLTSLVVDDT